MWIWVNLDPDRLPMEVKQAFGQKGAEFAISAVTVWETVLAAQKGRIKTVLTPEENARAWLKASPIRVIPIDEEIAILSRTLQFEHSDPADRFIAATAFHFGIRLATSDGQLRKLPWLKFVS